jgi:hypothetical protein
MAPMSKLPDLRTLRATLSPSLRATLGPVRPLLYRHGANPLEDLPAHVRAASSVRRQRGRLVIVQDDVNALAVLDPSTGSVSPILLPAGPEQVRVFDDARGNKKSKLDLEAAVVLADGRLVAFGSGSSPQRETIVTLAARHDALAQQLSGEALYRALRVHAHSRGARLNVEGAVVQGPWLRLLQRAGGKRGFEPWSAILDMPLEPFTRWLDGRQPCPPVHRIVEVDLGDAGGIPFGFTDAAVASDGRLAFVACAEDTMDALDDGPVLGCRFGWVDVDDRGVVMAPIVDDEGQPTRLKLEGIEPRADATAVFDVVADVDDGEAPALIAELTVRE